MYCTETVWTNGNECTCQNQCSKNKARIEISCHDHVLAHVHFTIWNHYSNVSRVLIPIWKFQYNCCQHWLALRFTCTHYWFSCYTWRFFILVQLGIFFERHWHHTQSWLCCIHEEFRHREGRCKYETSSRAL